MYIRTLWMWLLPLTLCSIAMSNTSASEIDFPTRPITLIMPFPAGGGSDLLARVVAEKMGEILGNAIVVQNKDGAAGAVGMRQVAHAKPDGYTMGMSGVGTSILLGALGRPGAAQLDQELTVVGEMGTTGMVIAASPKIPVKSLNELFSYLQEHKNLTYGSGGVGTPGHIGMEALLKQAKASMVHVPYRGGSPLINDLLGGHVDVAVIGIPPAVDLIKADKISALTQTGAQRSELLPNLATAEEQGFNNFQIQLFNMLMVPVKTPQERIKRISDALRGAMSDVHVKSVLREQGIQTTPTTVAEARAFLDDQRKLWAHMMSLAGKIE